jgi:hypothetical protein
VEVAQVSDDDDDIWLGVSLDRVRGEHPAEFYSRLAVFHKAAQHLTGKPVAMIALSAKVTKATAARWVRQGRALGFLPPTDEGHA